MADPWNEDPPVLWWEAQDTDFAWIEAQMEQWPEESEEDNGTN